MSDHKIRILESCKTKIVQDDASGLYYYLDDPTRGFYTSDDLRIIADQLDKLNHKWYKVADECFSKKNESSLSVDQLQHLAKNSQPPEGFSADTEW